MFRWTLATVSILILGLLALNHAAADVMFVSGDVSGTWSADTVMVTDEVRVPPGDTLIIEPGVKVLFWAYCKLIVDEAAVLHAVGTQSDSILFDEYWAGNRWRGIRFLGTSDACSLAYCHLKHGWAAGSAQDAHGGGVYISRCNPTVTHCLIDSCSASLAGAVYCDYSDAKITANVITKNSAGYGGGICCYSSNPDITSNTISSNSASNYGGGIYCSYYSNPNITGNTIASNTTIYGGGIACWDYSNPNITSNTISSNSALHGGGISCYYSNPDITSNTIASNSPATDGGGIYCYYSNPNITSNTISSNSASYGGGIYCSYSNPSITSNTISSNSASNGYGGGIHCYSSNPSITSNTISSNSATYGGGIYFGASPSVQSEHNEISCNFAGESGGGIYLSSSSASLTNETIAYNRAGLGGGIYCTGSSPVVKNAILWGNAGLQIYQTSGSNTQATYSDIAQLWPGGGNINQDPMFVSPDCAGDYHLQPSSPCIDAGDPNPVYNDPDGTRADMGCYYFDQLASIPQRPEVPTTITAVLHNAQPNPFSSSTVVKFSLPEPGDVEIEIIDVSGSIVATLVDGWRNAGFQEAVFACPDLAPGVYFCHLKAGDQVAVSKIVKVR